MMMAAMFVALTACNSAPRARAASPQAVTVEVAPALRPVLESALEQMRVTVGYDPRMCGSRIGGDVPMKTGVCSDVVVRAFRKGAWICRKQFTKTWQATSPCIRNAGA